MIYWELFITFFKIGAFTFGGGYAMLPMIEQEVMNHEWMSIEELVNFIAVSESTPGPFAVNCSTYVGTTLAGLPGAICATLGVVLPSFIVILLIAKAYQAFRQNKYVNGAMGGLRPTVVGLIGAALISIGSSVFFKDGYTLSVLSTTRFWVSLILFGCATYLTQKKGTHPVKIIGLAAVVGIACGYAGLL